MHVTPGAIMEQGKDTPDSSMETNPEEQIPDVNIQRYIQDYTSSDINIEHPMYDTGVVEGRQKKVKKVISSTSE